MVKDMNIPPRKLETEDIVKMKTEEIWKDLFANISYLSLCGIPDNTIFTFLRLTRHLFGRFIISQIRGQLKNNDYGKSN